jgi:glutathione S-transferase
MPTLYGISASPYVRKVRVALEEKGIAYEHDPVIPMNVSAEYKKISPLGKVPAYKDGDHAIADSSVIIAYLEKVKPQPALYPSDPYEYARALWFEEYGDSALVSVTGPKIFFQRVVAPKFLNQKCDEAVVQKAVDEELPPYFDYLEREVGDGGVVAGTRFSIGDIGLVTHFVNLKFAGFGVDAKRWPRLARYVDHVMARPSFKKFIDEEAPLFSA